MFDLLLGTVIDDCFRVGAISVCDRFQERSCLLVLWTSEL